MSNLIRLLLVLLSASAAHAAAIAWSPADQRFMADCSARRHLSPGASQLSPLEQIRGTTFENRFVRAFYGSLGPEETCQIAANIVSEAARRASVSAAGGLGVAASFVAALLNPLTLLLGAVGGYARVPLLKTVGVAALLGGVTIFAWMSSTKYLWEMPDLAFNLFGALTGAVITYLIVARYWSKSAPGPNDLADDNHIIKG